MSKRRYREGVTVITPSLPDRAHLLEEAKASVAAQTLQPVAHLVGIDDEFRGPGPILNDLVNESTTEWLSILADDDLYDPDHLETLYAERDNGSIILSWGRMEGRDMEQYRGEFDPAMLARREDTGMRGIFMFRKTVWERLGGFAEVMEDWNFLLRASEQGIRFAPVYRETWTYRWHGGNTSTIIGELAEGRIPDQLYHLERHVDRVPA